jgi:hypothetical protein
MYLTAISVGYAVPAGNFAASVHSVFQSALNLRLKKNNGLLLTLLASGEGELPQGIRLDTPKDFSFEDFQTSQPAVCKDSILHFENSSLTIQLSGARRWKCDLPALKFDVTTPTVSATWSLVWEALNKRQISLGSEIVAGDLLRSDKSPQRIVSRKSGEALRALVNATRRYELTDPSPANSLIGLGPGLTPSGDDLLVGYLAGLWCTVRGKSERAQFIASLGKTIIRLSRQTNDISRTYLYHAARGQVSSRLANLAEAISDGENLERLLKIAESAMRVGHTSGMDAVTGLLMGLTAWDGEDII